MMWLFADNTVRNVAPGLRLVGHHWYTAKGFSKSVPSELGYISHNRE